MSEPTLYEKAKAYVKAQEAYEDQPHANSEASVEYAHDALVDFVIENDLDHITIVTVSNDGDSWWDTRRVEGQHFSKESYNGPLYGRKA